MGTGVEGPQVRGSWYDPPRGGAMSTPWWVGLYVAQALFWVWLARWGGASWLRGWPAAFFVHPVAWRWDEEVIQLFAWLSLAGTTLWFVLGLFDRSLRVW